MTVEQALENAERHVAGSTGPILAAEVKRLREVAAHGAWGNYVAIHFLEWLMGQRKIERPEDVGMEINDLPRLLKQAKAYEKECADASYADLKVVKE